MNANRPPLLLLPTNRLMGSRGFQHSRSAAPYGIIRVDRGRSRLRASKTCLIGWLGGWVDWLGVDDLGGVGLWVQKK